MEHSHVPAANPDVHHETSDVNIRAIFGFAAGLAVVAVLIHLLVYVLFNYFAAREAVRVPRQFPLSVGQDEKLPPEPRLQVNPRDDLQTLRSSEDAVLGGYSWVDKDKGVVRIPIDEAMKLTVQRGLPVRKDSEAVTK
jgi:hypothetical protein